MRGIHSPLVASYDTYRETADVFLLNLPTAVPVCRGRHLLRPVPLEIHMQGIHKGLTRKHALLRIYIRQLTWERTVLTHG